MPFPTKVPQTDSPNRRSQSFRIMLDEDRFVLPLMSCTTEATMPRQSPTVKTLAPDVQITPVTQRQPGSADDIPDKERWVHGPEHMRDLREALAWAKATPPRVTDLDALFERLK